MTDGRKSLQDLDAQSEQAHLEKMAFGIRASARWQTFVEQVSQIEGLIVEYENMSCNDIADAWIERRNEAAASSPAAAWAACGGCEDE